MSLSLYALVGEIKFIYLFITFERSMVFEFLIFFGIKFHRFAPDTDSFLPQCCSSMIYMYIRAVSGYSLRYLDSEVLFTFESAVTYKFLYMNDASFRYY